MKKQCLKEEKSVVQVSVLLYQAPKFAQEADPQSLKTTVLHPMRAQAVATSPVTVTQGSRIIPQSDPPQYPTDKMSTVKMMILSKKSSSSSKG